MSEVREGYKMTELGVVPSEWEVVSQGQISTFYNGRAYKQTEFKTSGTPIIRIQNLTGEKIPVYSDLELEDNKYAQKGDLLYAWSATFGPYIWEGPKSIFHYHIWKVDVKSNILDKLFYFYRLDFVSKELQGKKNGFSFVHITKGFMESHKIALPPLSEQQKIASILSTVDEQIDETEQLIIKTKELKKGLMQQLLTKGIGHTEFKQTELGEIPNEWQISSFESVFELIDGDRSKKYPSPNEIVESGILFLSTANIKNQKLNLEDIKFITQEKFEALSKGKLVYNDLIITLRGTLGSIALFNNERFQTGFINAQMMILRSLKVINPNFAYYYLTSELTKQQISLATSGSAQPQLTKKELKLFKLALPSLEEQQKIAQILSTVDEQIEVYELEKAKYEELKKGLMQQLLTGQIRVKI